MVNHKLLHVKNPKKVKKSRKLSYMNLYCVRNRHLCSNKNIYLSESNTNNPKCYLLMQFAVNLAEKKLLN